MALIESALEKAKAGAVVQRAQQGVSASAIPAGASQREAAQTRSWLRWSAAAPLVPLDFDELRRAGIVGSEEAVVRQREEYRAIKKPLLDRVAGRGTEAAGTIVLVTSALPREGKTFTSLNIALSLSSEQDLAVLLVDSDLAKRDLTQLLRLERQTGLVDLLRGPGRSLEQCIVRTQLPNLFVMPAGPRDDQATELLGSQRMGTVARELRSLHPDVIVMLDSAPLLVAADSAALAAAAGQVLLVVKSADTPQEAVLEAIARLGKTRPVSLLLNQREPVRLIDREFYYGAYHGAPYARGS